MGNQKTIQSARTKDILYFCDESSYVSDEFMAVAGLAINRKMIPRVVKRLEDIKKKYGKRGEVKWQNARSRGGEVHRAYIDLLFLLVEKNFVHFHIRFAPFREYDHRLSGPLKKVDTVSKMYYQLILHRPIRYYSQNCNLYIYPDDGDCTKNLPSMINALSTEELKRYPSCHPTSCVKLIQPRSSIREPLLQLLDVPLGALTAHRNNKHLRPDANKVRNELIEYTMKKTGLSSLRGNTPINQNTFSVWNVRPKW